MRTLTIAILTLFAGLVIGSWLPRAELVRVRAEVDRLEKIIRDGAATESRLGGLAGILRLDDSETRHASRSQPSSSTNAVSGVSNAAPAALASAADGTIQTNNTAANDTDTAGNDTDENASERQPSTLSEQIKRASELWEVRSQMARRTFIENAGFTDEQTMAFDVLVEAMNIRLENKFQQWADYLQERDNMSSEDGARLLNDMTSVMVLTYDEMDRKLGAEWRESSEKSFDLVDFIDPTVATPLTAVEGRIDARRDARRQRFRNR